MEMTQFRVCHAIYAGYTLIYLMEVDSEGYLIGEHTIRSESNNIRLNQNFRQRRRTDASLGEWIMSKFYFRVTYNDSYTKENWIFAESRTEAFCQIATLMAKDDATMRSIEITHVTA